MLSPDQNRGFWLWSGVLLVIDRLLRVAAMHGIEAHSSYIDFTLFMNHGIAFSLPISGPLIWVVSLAIITWAMSLLLKDLKQHRTARLIPLSLFILGAASNLFDRIVYGFTIDYLIFFQRSAINLGDVMIVIGALWLILSDREKLNTYSSSTTTYAGS